MSCACDPFGLLDMRRAADNTRFVFRCDCLKGKRAPLQYTEFSASTHTGFIPWFSKEDHRKAEALIKGCFSQDGTLKGLSGLLRPFRDANFLVDLDVSQEAEAIRKEGYLACRPIDFPEDQGGECW